MATQSTFQSGSIGTSSYTSFDSQGVTADAEAGLQVLHTRSATCNGHRADVTGVLLLDYIASGNTLAFTNHNQLDASAAKSAELLFIIIYSLGPVVSQSFERLFKVARAAMQTSNMRLLAIMMLCVGSALGKQLTVVDRWLFKPSQAAPYSY